MPPATTSTAEFTPLDFAWQADQSSLRSHFDHWFRRCFILMLTLTVHTVIFAVLVGGYRHVKSKHERLALQIGVQQAFANMTQGMEREVEAMHAEEEQPEQDPVVQPPVEAVTPQPLAEQQREIETIGLQGPRNGDADPEKIVPRKYSSRRGDAKSNALGKFGGDESTEAAVSLALDWLARHQSPSGCWDVDGFDRQCSSLACQAKRFRFDTSIYDVGTTGLCVLAFLGAGYAEDSDGYGETVGRALRFLLAQQQSDGCLVNTRRENVTYPLYDHAVSLYALVEACNLTQDPKYREPIERGIAYLLQGQQSNGGWDYVGERTGRGDVSIAGWAVMALESARLGGFSVSEDAMTRALRFFKTMTLPSGVVKYATQGQEQQRRGVGLTAVGVYSRLMLGESAGASSIRKGIDLIDRNPPDWQVTSTDTTQQYTTYYWYYGTLAMFNVGGEQWERWNEGLKKTLVGNQRRDGCAAGSWDPVDPWLGQFGGRIFSTVSCLLSLEVYYRYLPLYQKEQGDIQAVLQSGGPATDAERIAMLLDASLEAADRKKILTDAISLCESMTTPADPASISPELTEAVIAASDYFRDDPICMMHVYILLDRFTGDREKTVDFFRRELNRCRAEQLNTVLSALANLNATEAVRDLIDRMATADAQAKKRIHGALVAITGESRMPCDPDRWDAWWRLRKE